MENELYHFGVKGMKWGVRRSKGQTSTQSFRAKRAAKKQELLDNAHEDYKKAHEKKSVSSMSDTELRARINRIQMEQQYAKLSPSKTEIGKQRVQNTLKGMTTVAATTGTILTLYNNANKIREIIEKAN